MKNFQITRRGALQVTAAGVASAALPGFTQSQFAWKQQSGESIEVLLVKNPRGELLTKNHREFEDLTGIKVASEMVPEQQQRQKYIIEFNSGKPSFDVLQWTPAIHKRLFAKAKWLEDLRPLMRESIPANWDLADIAPIGMAAATQADNRVDSLPINLDPWFMYYNRELFAAKDLQAPTTFDELLAAAAALHEPSKGIFGMVGRGLKNANVPLWTSFFLGFGGEFVDTKGRLQTASSAAVASATLYRDLLGKYGPAGIAGFNWNESQSLFMQGKAAIWIDGSGFALPVEDATRSRVAGKVGYAAMPRGPKAHAAITFADVVGVTSTSKRKAAAYRYALWASSKAMQARVLEAGAGAPIRFSAFKDQAALAGLKVPKGWLQAVSESLAIGVRPLPTIQPVSEFRDVFGIALTNMLGGADPASELKKATAEFQTILDDSEKKA